MGKYSRHPNYFGEILMWVGLCVSCSYSFSGWGVLGWLSPAFNAFLLLFVSGVPLLEKAGQERWGNEPAYQHYMENTSCIVPWFPAPPIVKARFVECGCINVVRASWRGLASGISRFTSWH